MITCKNCNQSISEQARFCPVCGQPVYLMMENVSPKLRGVAALLCFFVGTFGVHRFYVEKIATGILMILTLGGLGIWTLIDFILILCGSFRDKQNRLLLIWFNE